MKKLYGIFLVVFIFLIIPSCTNQQNLDNTPDDPRLFVYYSSEGPYAIVDTVYSNGSRIVINEFKNSCEEYQIDTLTLNTFKKNLELDTVWHLDVPPDETNLICEGTQYIAATIHGVFTQKRIPCRHDLSIETELNKNIEKEIERVHNLTAIFEETPKRCTLAE